MNLFQQYLTLSELNEKIRLRLNPFARTATWVVAEIADISVSGRGHVYAELVEKENNRIVAKLQAVIWADKAAAIQRKFGSDTAHLLKKGNKVLVKATVDFHAVYGLKITITDLDPSVTMGELERKRLRIIQQLEEGGFIGLNAELPLPDVLQRIAVISSPTAAGYGDFINQLQHNPYGYQIAYQLFPAAMQGDRVEEEVIQQLKTINKHSEQFDAVVIIRGGGSKLDLTYFDNYAIATQIATMPIPVLTGIGHQRDESIVDLVAHTPLKTPTAVADYILQTFVNFEMELLHWREVIQKMVLTALQLEEKELQKQETYLRLATHNFLQTEEVQFTQYHKQIQKDSQRLLQKEELELNYMKHTFQLLNVESLLKRGFSISRLNGKVVTTIEELQEGIELETQLQDGVVYSRIQGKK